MVSWWDSYSKWHEEDGRLRKDLQGNTYMDPQLSIFYSSIPATWKHTINIYVLYCVSFGVSAFASFLPWTRLLVVCAARPRIASRDSLWQWWWEYAPLLLSSVIICDRLYGQARLVTQPHTGLLSIIWLISILYNALLPTATVNERIVTRSLSRVNQRQDREHLCECCSSGSNQCWRVSVWIGDAENVIQHV